jgi:hypothetical protein
VRIIAATSSNLEQMVKGRDVSRRPLLSAECYSN